MIPMDERTARLLVETEWLHGLTRRLVSDPELAADVAQETLAVAWRRRLHDVADVRAWLATVARNFARRLGRNRQRHERLERAVPAAAATSQAPAVDDVVAKAEAQRAVVDAVLRLREPYRSTLLLHYLEGMTLPAIATQQAAPLETVRARLRRGLQQVRAELDAEHGGVRGWAVPILGSVGFAAAAPAGAAAATTTATAGVATLLLAATAVLALAVVASFAGSRPEPLAGGAATAASTPPPTTTPPLDPLPDAGARAATTTSAPAANDAAPAGKQVLGRLVDRETGAAIAGAELTLLPPDDPFAPTAGPLAMARSGDDGAFQLPVAGMRQGSRVRIHSQAHALTTLTVSHAAAQRLDAPGPIHLGTIDLPRGTGYAGTVRAHDGTPLANALVCTFETANAAGGIKVLATATRWTTSDDGGRYVLPRRFAPQAGEVWLLAITDQGLGYRRIDPSARASDVDDFDVTLRPAAPLRVRCVDDRGTPIAGARATLWPAFQPLSGPLDVVRTLEPPALAEALLTATTDARGEALLMLPVGEPATVPKPQNGREYVVRVAAAGHRRVERPLLLPPEGATTFVLARGTLTTVRGRVVDPFGRGLAHATARVGEGPELVTDERGAFVQEHVDVGRGTVVVMAKARGHLPETKIVDVASTPGEVELAVVLPPASRCGGVVVDQDAQPVAGARITFAGQLTESDHAGRWHLEVAPDVQGLLGVSPPKDGMVWTSLAVVEANAGEHRLVLTRLGPPAGLSLELRDRATGALLEPAQASAELLDDHREYRRLGGDGTRIVADNLVAGRWRVQVRTRDGHTGVRTFDVAPGRPAAPTRWELAPAGELAVTLRGPWTGVLPEDVLVQCDPAGPHGFVPNGGDGRGDSDGPGNGELVLRAGGDGGFRLPHAPGDEELVLRATSVSFAGTLRVRVAAGGRTEAELRLERGGVLQLEAPRRRGPIGTDVTLTAIDGTFTLQRWLARPREATSNGATAVLRFAVPPGRYRYRAVSHVPAGANEVQDGELEVRATPAGGAPTVLRID